MISTGLRSLPFLALATAWGLSASAHAHFVLTSPGAVFEQNALGDPQKAPPCGDNGTAVATGTITTFSPGETITVEINETIFHPGHYRIALAINDPSELPEPPPVTVGSTPCGSAPIDPAPAFPVLADGLWVHDAPFAGPQTIEITLPDDVTCDACTLQVIQFMSNHALNDPGGCYYHHCATIAIEGQAATTGDPGDDTAGASEGGEPAGDSSGGGGVGDTGGGGNGSTGAGEEGGTAATAGGTQGGGDGGSGDEDESGCGCSTDGSRPPLGGLLLLGLVGLGVRRRRLG